MYEYSKFKYFILKMNANIKRVPLLRSILSSGEYMVDFKESASP